MPPPPVDHYLLGFAQQAGPAPGGGIQQFALIGIIFAIFYFLVIRPQGKKAKETQQMLAALKKGDDVVTTGGVIGRITGIKDDEITLQVQEGVRLRVLRSAVTGLHKGVSESAKAEKAEAKAAS